MVLEKRDWVNYQLYSMTYIVWINSWFLIEFAERFEEHFKSWFVYWTLKNYCSTTTNAYYRLLKISCLLPLSCLQLLFLTNYDWRFEKRSSPISFSITSIRLLFSPWMNQILIMIVFYLVLVYFLLRLERSVAHIWQHYLSIISTAGIKFSMCLVLRQSYGAFYL